MPDDVNEAFGAAFKGQNKRAIAKQAMREAMESAEGKKRSRAASTRFHQARPTQAVRSA